MTTDITELAQREKFEAWAEECNALPWGYLKKLRIYTGFYSDHTYTSLWAAWKAAGAELVEALEKAQQVDEELCRLLPPGAEYMDPPDGGDVTPLEGVRRMVADYRQRIAELESRTVTDWIEHDGKWRPESLGLDELVYLKTRKQELKIPYPAGKVKGWMNTGGDMDVMAYKLASPQASTVTAAAADVLAERKRQVTTEGWTPEHDDQHVNFEMAIAGGLYAISAVDSHHKLRNSAPSAWPWDRKWWKPDGPRRDLVKAGALILAEIERLDRAAGIKVEVE
ncbi:hypothetical protein M4C62_24640 [Klebsiella pneumoniae]|uniref:hypothetical protein n=2 Tax=Klebsiella pneumoniae TaxID=573 RepID=UPI002073D9CF|nr:hypothetical protein [Klebsiella pneumoniae]MCM6089307.1 hypothetical protein [Klebsiella pneumoniae]MCM6568714.1 hypothetical protein [Klebsiella pneumoniae]MDZ1597040.1 hypothetical protein [Klebsiella pneumoniae]MDZ1747426.1 hypothetical protein [Klebsiella pneumoniae]MDZ1816350.1 hypothetical protein [Klebsiella pneumoniae]